MTSSSDLLPIALGVLPRLPCEVTCLRTEGGQLQVGLLEQRDDRLYGELDEIIDRDHPPSLTVPIASGDGGGYWVSLEIDEVYFLGGLQSAALLRVADVRRKKPYRDAPRIIADANARIQLVSPQGQSGEAMAARVLDVSASGIALNTPLPFAMGDQLSVETAVHGISVRGHCVVAQVSRLAFGRVRVGCQFTSLPAHTAAQLQLVAEQAPAELRAA